MYTIREAAAAVRELREAQGLTQSALAEKAQVSRSFLADLERGKSTIEAAKLFDVFQALGFEIALLDRASGEFRK